jgi:hypothetical protein
MEDAGNAYLILARLGTSSGSGQISMIDPFKQSVRRPENAQHNRTILHPPIPVYC